MRDQVPLSVHVVYLARLREAFGSAGESLRLTSEAGTTVADILDRLRCRGGPFATELAPGRAVRVAVNHAMAGPGDPVREGDEVAIFPPVTGG
jgi:molybdopterin synthase sulfur carrier subunit